MTEEIEIETAESPNTQELPSLPIEISRQLLKIAFASLGDITAKITNVEEAKFDQEEIELLAEVWSPYIPNLPPFYNALLTTVIIVCKKAAIIIHKKKQNVKLSQTITEIQT